VPGKLTDCACWSTETRVYWACHNVHFCKSGPKTLHSAVSPVVGDVTVTGKENGEEY